MKYIKLLKGVFKCCIINEIEYRVNFFLRATIELSYLILSVVMFDVIYMNVTDIAGWTKNEMLLLVLITNYLDSIITFLFNAGLSEIPKMINEGTMDFLMIKPVNKRFYLTFRKFELSQLINIIINICFSSYVIHDMNISITLGKFVVFMLLLFIGVFIMYNIFFFVMIMSFWTVKIDIGISLFYQLFHVGNKPADIFTKGIKCILIYIIPVLVAFNFPVQYLVGKLEMSKMITAGIVAMVLFVATNVFFKCSLKKYSSVGC